MDAETVFQVAGAIIASLGGGALLVASMAHWLGGIWAKRMLQNERAKHSEDLEGIKSELEVLKNINITRHQDKLSTYREAINIIAHTLRELEAVSQNRQSKISEQGEQYFSLNRFKVYGYISLVSNQDVMDKYNDLIDFLIPVIYQEKVDSWVAMRNKVDALLNAIRKDLGVTEGDIFYRGLR